MQEVRVEWGIMMNTCHISLMEGDRYGPTLMFARGDNPDDRNLGELLSGLVSLNKERISLAQLHSLLPPKGSITWGQELKGDRFSSYEIRGKGNDFKAFITVKHGDMGTELDVDEKKKLLEQALQAREIFFP